MQFTHLLFFRSLILGLSEGSKASMDCTSYLKSDENSFFLSIFDQYWSYYYSFRWLYSWSDVEVKGNRQWVMTRIETPREKISEQKPLWLGSSNSGAEYTYEPAKAEFT